MNSENSENYEINSETLRYYRKFREYSQEDLAVRIGVKPNTVSRWEMGKFKVTQKYHQQLVEVLGVSLEVLGEPVPAHKLRALENIDTRTNATISVTAKMALDIVSETYHINKDAIMDIAPFMFHVIAAASLGRRAEKLDEVNKEIGAVMEACNEKIPYISDKLYFDNQMCAYSLFEEEEAIDNNQLFFSDKISDDVNDISTNPFSLFLKSFVDLTPEKLNELFEVEWRNDELPRYHITESFIRDILLIPVDEDLLKQIMELVLNGSMSLKEINYRASAGWMSNDFIEKNKEALINMIKELVAEKHAAHQTSKQPASGEDQ